MSLFDPIRYSQQSPAEFNYYAATQLSGFGEYLGAKIKSGFDFSISGRLSEQVDSHPEGGPLPPGVAPDIASGMMGLNVDERRVTEDEWRKLRLDRPGLAYSGGGTVEYETARTRAFDERRYRDSIIARYQGGIGGQVVGFGAQMLGGLPSPENFIPFVGPEIRAAMVARMGTIGGHAAASSLDASIGTALADAVVLPDLARRGEDVGAGDFALDLVLGAVTGGLLGTGGGLLARRAEGRARTAMLAEAARAVRLDGLERQGDALELSLRALADDQPVEVGPVLAEAMPAIQRRMEQSYIRAYHGSPHRFDQFSMEHIGSGEGAQAFGHGLYFAENQSIANFYLKKLSTDNLFFKDRQIGDLLPDSKERENAYRFLDDYKDIESAIDVIEARLNKPAKDFGSPEADRAGLEGLKKLQEMGVSNRSDFEERPAGNLYSVDLAVSRDELLDWDKPLSEQPAKVREAIESHPDPLISGTAAKWGGDIKAMIDRIASRVEGGAVEVSRRLREAGIKGIQYLDAGSRADGDGSRNIVMFDDALVHIREINGTAVERTPEPHPSIIEAESSVRQAPPKTGVEEAQRLAKDMAVENPPELEDIKVLKRDGLLSAADEAELERAAETVKDANGWADAYTTLSTCVLRFGA